jgi:hypothetical protein
MKAFYQRGGVLKAFPFLSREIRAIRVKLFGCGSAALGSLCLFAAIQIARNSSRPFGVSFLNQPKFDPNEKAALLPTPLTLAT